MTDTLLRSLRATLLDESEPLAGLLRKCLLLGAETGSVQLRDWARRELNGYEDSKDVPNYRTIPTPTILMDSVSGNNWAKNVPVNLLTIPESARKHVNDVLHLQQPVEELEQLARSENIAFTTPGLMAVMALWSRELDMFQEIIGMRYALSPSAISGVLGQIRTRLVDVVADLTSDTPLEKLPSKAQVDSAVGAHLGVGDTYNTTIHNTSGAVAVGGGAVANAQSGLTVADAVVLLDAVSKAAFDLDPAIRAEVEQAAADLRGAITADAPDTGVVVKKAGRLRDLAGKVGVATVASAIGGAASAVTELALGGAFG